MATSQTFGRQDGAGGEAEQGEAAQEEEHVDHGSAPFTDDTELALRDVTARCRKGHLA